MPQEPAYADKRSKDCGAKSASERAEGTMPSANVRRWGVENTAQAVIQDGVVRGLESLETIFGNPPPAPPPQPAPPPLTFPGGR